MGVLALITRLQRLGRPGPRGFLGAALLVVGLGLVIAAFTGGRTARGGLIALGIVLSVALITVSTLPWNGVRGGVGDRTYRPATAADVRDVYRGGFGDVTVDLSRLDRRPRRAGHHEHRPRRRGPRGHPPAVRGRATGGRAGSRRPARLRSGCGDGRLLPGRGSRPWTDDGQAEFVVTIHSGLGDVEVSRG